VRLLERHGIVGGAVDEHLRDAEREQPPRRAARRHRAAEEALDRRVVPRVPGR
jgi:hypothetical protein